MTEAEIGLLGVVLGAVLAGGADVFLDWRTHKRKRNSLIQAFRADIEAISYLIGYRDYIKMLRKNASAKTLVYIEVQQNYLELYETQISEIGILPDHLVNLIVGYYTLQKSALEDVKNYCCKGAPKDAYLAYNELADLLDTMLALQKEFSKKATEFLNPASCYGL